MSMFRALLFSAAAIVSICGAAVLRADDIIVNTPGQFNAALSSAADGDVILLEPGTYPGRFSANRLVGVTIRSADPDNPAVINAAGVGEGIKLESCDRITVDGLIIENASLNGINVDDISFMIPSSNIVLRNLVVRNGGGHGIKFAGVDGFLIDHVTVSDWGSGFAGMDLIGAHDGIVQNSLVKRSVPSVPGFGIKATGGSANITIRANRLVESGERAIQFGGGVSLSVFRPQPPGNVAASGIIAEGNVIVDRGSGASGIRAGVAYVNVDGSIFRNNLISRPRLFVGRILKETTSEGFIDTQNGVFRNNIILWNNGDFSPSQPFNSGPGTLPATFHFEGNTWFNVTNPANSTVTLPAPEIDGVYGVNPGVDSNSVIPWQFDWGTWLVNATENPQSFDLGTTTSLVLATPNEGATFDIGLASPLMGDWSLSPLSSPVIDLDAFSYAVLIAEDLGDYNEDGIADAADFTVWRDTLGQTGLMPFSGADGNGNGTIDLGDYDVWMANFGAIYGSVGAAQVEGHASAVPEPAAAFLLVNAVIFQLSLAWGRRRRTLPNPPRRTSRR